MQKYYAVRQGTCADRRKFQKDFQDPVTCKAARLTGCKNISKIERIGEYRVRALDWDNLEFVTDRTVGDDITAIGIRAHDFEPLAGEKAKTKKEAGEENLIPVVNQLFPKCHLSGILLLVTAYGGKRKRPSTPMTQQV